MIERGEMRFAGGLGVVAGSIGMRAQHKANRDERVSTICSLALLTVLLGSPLSAGGIPERLAPRDQFINREEQWLVAETCATLDALIRFANGAGPDPKTLVRVSSDGSTDFLVFVVPSIPPDPITGPLAQIPGLRLVQTSQLPLRIDVGGWIFDPGAYARAAAARLNAAPPRPPAPADKVAVERVLSLLLDPTPSHLHEAGRLASEVLTRDPRSRAGHEAAAATIGALGMRESAGEHTDVRALLARATAHLAMAELSKDETSLPLIGPVARFSHSYLAGRRGEALERARSFPQDSPVARSWKSAGSLLATEDTREVSWDRLTTFIEKLAYLRAFEDRVGGGRAFRFLKTLSPEWLERADWGRTLVNSGRSVQACNTYGDEQARVEINEANAAARTFLGTNFDLGTPADWGQLIQRLGEEAPPGLVTSVQDPKRAEVLPWGLLAASYQRHVGAALSSENDCTFNVLGQRDDMEPILAAQEKWFGNLPLFAIGAFRWPVRPSEYERLAALGSELVRQRPDLVPPHLWFRLVRTRPGAKAREDVPRPEAWFRPRSPRGSHLPDTSRFVGVLKIDKPTIAEYDDVISVDPFDTVARDARARLKLGENPDAKDLEVELGPALAWTSGAMASMANLKNIGLDEKRRWSARLCDIAAENCGTLGLLERENGRPEEAERAYFRLWRDSDDRVVAANDVVWLVERLRSTGRISAAFEIAEGAAEVYSYRGLETLAKLQEAVGKIAEAHETWSKLADRYNSRDDLFSFFFRQIAAGKSQFRTDMEKLEREIFPAGRKKDDAADGPPSGGVIITVIYTAPFEQGFRFGDILVAINGTRVESVFQVAVLLTEAPSDLVSVRLFRRGKFITLTPTIPQRRLAGAADYPLGSTGK